MATIKRQDIGLAGAIIVLSQFIGNFQSSQTVSKEIVKFREEFEQTKIDLEHYFVRKTDLNPILSRIDIMNDRLIKLNEQVLSVKQVVKSRNIFEEAQLSHPHKIYFE